MKSDILQKGGGKTATKEGGNTMYILYYKQLHIVKEPMRQNCTCQTYRNKQIAMCEERQPLQDYIDRQADKDRYFIEEQPER